MRKIAALLACTAIAALSACQSTASGSATSSQLVGTWTPTSIAGTDPARFTNGAGAVTFAFSPAPEFTPQFSGYDGCNTVSASYAIRPDGHFVSAEEISTLIGCPPEFIPVPVLTNVANLQIQGSELLARNADGVVIATYQRSQ